MSPVLSLAATTPLRLVLVALDLMVTPGAVTDPPVQPPAEALHTQQTWQQATITRHKKLHVFENHASWHVALICLRPSCWVSVSHRTADMMCWSMMAQIRLGLAHALRPQKLCVLPHYATSGQFVGL